MGDDVGLGRELFPQIAVVVAHRVLRVFELIAGQDCHYVLVRPHRHIGPLVDEAPDTRQGGRGRRLTTDTVRADHRLGIGDGLLIHFGTPAIAPVHRAARLLPAHRRADLNRRG